MYVCIPWLFLLVVLIDSEADIAVSVKVNTPPIMRDGVILWRVIGPPHPQVAGGISSNDYLIAVF